MARGNGNRAPARITRDDDAAIYGAIDLGTNNCRLLLARPTAEGFHVVDGFSRIVRLGEGLNASEALCAEAMDRTVAALGICAKKMRAWGCQRSRAVATEACRRAANVGTFIDRVSAKTGIAIEPISAAEEARFTLEGCRALLNAEVTATHGALHDHVLLFDIGGGSTEVVWAPLVNGEPALPIAVHSLPFGVVTLAEEYGKAPLSVDAFEALVRRVDDRLGPLDAEHGISARIAGGRVRMIGTSGTVTTLGATHLGLTRYDRARVDGLILGRDRLLTLADELAAMDMEARQRHPCIGAGRADLMIMGLAVLSAVMRRWPAQNLIIADRGVREGLLLEMMAADAALPRQAKAGTPHGGA